MSNAIRVGITVGTIAVAAASALTTRIAWGADGATQPAAAQLEEITITAAKLRSLEQFTPTGSRLGLSQQELPATLDVIDKDEMIGRGRLQRSASGGQPAGSDLGRLTG